MNHGKHVVADFWGVKIPEDIEQMMRAAAERARATPLEFIKHRFAPQGISAVLILAESHISIHTWPEDDFVAVDCYTCGGADPMRAVEYIRERIEAQGGIIKTIERGEQ